MLVAQDLLLLLLDDASGKTVARPDQALAGAVLVELAQLGLVDVAGQGELVRAGRIVLRDAAPPDHPVLRMAMVRVAERVGQRPERLIDPLAKGLRAALSADLVQLGLLRAEPQRVLGLFPVTRFMAGDPSYEAALRDYLGAVLVGAQAPDERSGPLIGLLSAMSVVTRVIRVPDGRAAKRRAKEIERADWASAAVRKAVQAAQNATNAAMIASSAAIMTTN